VVLTFAIWNDATGYMNWLDGGSNGPCDATEGNPTNIIQNNPTTHVVFSGIRWGDIGSTFSSGGGGGGTTSSKAASTLTTSKASTATPGTKTATTTKVSTTTSAAGPAQTHYGRE
jgi:cellulase